MSRAPWHAEHALEPEAMVAVLERRFPEFDAPTVIALEHGWDYFAFQVDDDWVFKVPKRAKVVSRMRQEVSLLTALPTMPASIPRPTFHGVAAADLPVPFFGYPRLDGRFATSGVDAGAVLPQLLDFLAALHSIEPPFAVEEPHDGPWQRQVDRLAAVRDAFPQLSPGWEWMRTHPPSEVDRLVLLHADLGPEHVLLDFDSPRLLAIIDWADAFRGDPARDLAPLLLWDPAATALAHQAHSNDTHELERAFAYALKLGMELLRDLDRWGAKAREAHLQILIDLQRVIP